MKKGEKNKTKPLDFIVDGLTKSIELSATSERFETMVLPLEKTDLPTISKKAGWKFDWKQEQVDGAKVYKLLLIDDLRVIQGLAAFYDAEGFIEMSLLESAPFNVGKGQKYIGVAGNLVAFGCTLSLQKGFGGRLVFTPKTILMEHYEKTLGAQRILGTQRMAIYEQQAKRLINMYFPLLNTNQGEQP